MRGNRVTLRNPQFVRKGLKRDNNALYVTELAPELDRTFLPILLRFVGLDEARSRSSQPLVTQGRIGDLLGPVPPILEQRQIVLKLQSLSESVDRNEAALEDLSTLKRGLMQDLLTGRVRVPVD